MPAPSSRRSSVRGSASSVSRGPEAKAKPKAETEEIEILAPSLPDESAVGSSTASASAVSSRRSAVRSSRRSAAVSGTGKSPSGRTSARLPSAEDLAKRRQALKTGLMIALGVALTVVVVLVLVLVVFKKDVQAEAANAKLAEVERNLPNIDTRAEFEQASKTLTEVPDLPAFAPRKAALKKDLAEREDKVSAGEREVHVIENRKVLNAQLVKLNDPATDLDKLEVDCQAFMKNPVDPTGAPNAGYATEFAAAVNDVQVRLAAITSERGRREAAATTGAAQQVQLEIEGLIKDSKYSEALKVIDTAAGKFPKADFGRARTYVNESAASAWTSVEGYVKNHYDDFEAPGITQSVRQKALEEAHAKLDSVIATWGLDDYVAKARELRAKH